MCVCVCVCVCARARARARTHVLSHIQLLATPWTVGTSRFVCPWNFSGKNTEVACYFLLQGIFLTQGLNPSLSCLLD